MGWINRLYNRTINRDPKLAELHGLIFSQEQKSMLDQGFESGQEGLFNRPDQAQTLATLSRGNSVIEHRDESIELLGDPNSAEVAEYFTRELEKLSSHASVKFYLTHHISQLGLTHRGQNYFQNLLNAKGYKCDLEEARTIFVPLNDGSVAIRVILQGYALRNLNEIDENEGSFKVLISDSERQPIVTFDTTYLISPVKGKNEARLTVKNHYQIIHDDRVNAYLPEFKPSLFQRVVNYVKNNPVKTAFGILFGAGIVVGAIFAAPIVLPAIGLAGVGAFLSGVATLAGGAVAAAAIAAGGAVGGLITTAVNKLFSRSYKLPKVATIPSYQNVITSFNKRFAHYLDSQFPDSKDFIPYQDDKLPPIDKNLPVSLAIQKYYSRLEQDGQGRNKSNRAQNYINVVENFVQTNQARLDGSESVDLKTKLLLEATKVFAALSVIETVLQKLPKMHKDLQGSDEGTINDTFGGIAASLIAHLAEVTEALKTIAQLDSSAANQLRLASIEDAIKNQLIPAFEKEFLNIIGKSLNSWREAAENSQAQDNTIDDVSNHVAINLSSTGKMAHRLGTQRFLQAVNTNTEKPPVYPSPVQIYSNFPATKIEQSAREQHSVDLTTSSATLPKHKS